MLSKMAIRSLLLLCISSQDSFAQIELETAFGIKAGADCCNGTARNPLTADPLDLLRKVNGKDAELAIRLGRMVVQPGPIDFLYNEEMQRLFELDLLQEEWAFVLKVGSSELNSVQVSCKDISPNFDNICEWLRTKFISYPTSIEEGPSSNLCALSNKVKAPCRYEDRFNLTPASVSYFANVWLTPGHPLRTKLETTISVCDPDSVFDPNIQPCSPTTNKVWVKEPVYVIKGGDHKIVLALSQFTFPLSTTSKVMWGFKGLVPNSMNTKTAIDIADFWKLNATNEMEVQQLSAARDFVIGLIPVYGSIYQIKNSKNRTDLAIGVSGIIGDAGLATGLLADACKIPKLYRLLKAGGCYADIASGGIQLTLISKQFWDGNGTALSGALGAVAFARVFAAAILLKKVNREALIKELAQAPTPELQRMDLSAVPPGPKACPAVICKQDKVFEGKFVSELEQDGSKGVITIAAMKGEEKLGYFKGNTVYSNDRAINFGTVEIVVAQGDCRYGLNGTQLYRELFSNPFIADRGPGPWKLSSYFTWDNKAALQKVYKELVDSGVSTEEALKRATMATPTYNILVNRLGATVTQYPPSISQLSVEYTINLPLAK